MGCSYDYIRGLRSRSMHRASDFSNVGQGAINVIVTNRGGQSNCNKGHSRLFNSIRISLVGWNVIHHLGASCILNLESLVNSYCLSFTECNLYSKSRWVILSFWFVKTKSRNLNLHFLLPSTHSMKTAFLMMAIWIWLISNSNDLLFWLCMFYANVQQQYHPFTLRVVRLTGWSKRLREPVWVQVIKYYVMSFVKRQ